MTDGDAEFDTVVSGNGKGPGGPTAPLTPLAARASWGIGQDRKSGQRDREE